MFETKHKTQLKHLNEVKQLQKLSLTDDYMVGLYNGLELACAIMENREPQYEMTVEKPEICETKEEDKRWGRTVASGYRVKKTGS